MRHFTLASVLATALALGMLTATPSMAQTAQPATKSDSKMAPAPKASESKMARRRRPNCSTSTRRPPISSTRCRASARPIPPKSSRPAVQGQGRAGAEEHRPAGDLRQDQGQDHRQAEELRHFS